MRKLSLITGVSNTRSVEERMQMAYLKEADFNVVALSDLFE